MKKIVILISGGGSNMAAIVRAAQRDNWRKAFAAEVAAVISNRPDAGGLAFAREQGLAAEVVDHKQFASREAFDEALAAAIDRHAPALVVLAGFMRILTPAFVERYRGRLLNIHPRCCPPSRGCTRTSARWMPAAASPGRPCTRSRPISITAPSWNRPWCRSFRRHRGDAGGARADAGTFDLSESGRQSLEASCLRRPWGGGPERVRHADFVHLVRLSEHASAEDGKAYRRSLAAFAGLGCAWVLGCLLLAAGTLAWIAGVLLHGHFRAFQILGLTAAGGLLWASVRALWFRLEPAAGVRLLAARRTGACSRHWSASGAR
jgi:hypothetical protein